MVNKKLIQDEFGNWNYIKCSNQDMTYNLPDDTELLVVDWQLGNEDVNIKTLKQLVNWASIRENRYFVLQDFLDNNWLSKFSKLTYGSDDEEEELNLLKKQLDILKPVFNRFLFQIGSNHIDRQFGLNHSVKQSNKARTNFNKIYGEIYKANHNFKQYSSTECIIRINFKTRKTLKLVFIHPSRLGSANTVVNRAPNYYGYDGLVVGHIHSTLRKQIQSVLGHKLDIWFASHLFEQQPEYEKERMGSFEPSKPLILSWKQNPLNGEWKFDC